MLFLSIKLILIFNFDLLIFYFVLRTKCPNEFSFFDKILCDNFLRVDNNFGIKKKVDKNHANIWRKP